MQFTAKQKRQRRGVEDAAPYKACAVGEDAQKFATALGAQGTPLQTQSVCTYLSTPCTNCKCLPEIATGAKRPRNDKPSAFTILMTACFLHRCSAGRGMPLPYI